MNADIIKRIVRAIVDGSQQVSWDCVVEALSGASAAMVVKAAQDAAKAAVLGGQKIVTEAHLNNAIAELKRTDGRAHGG